MNKRLSAVVMPILLTAIGCVGAEVVAAAEPVGEIRLWPEGVPGDRVPSDPAEKVEKVVSPPRKPVIANSFQASGKCVLM